MENKIITDGTVSLSNGFQSGQFVTFIKLEDGKWVEIKTVGTGEATYKEDVLVENLPVILEGKRGVIVSFVGDSPHHRQRTVDGFFGFTAEELDAPTPEEGWSSSDHGFNAHEWDDVHTLEEYLIARFVNENFTRWDSMADGVHRMPYHWGDQDADSYVLIIGGKLIDWATGCGDQTPYLLGTDEQMIADRKLHYSSLFEDRREESKKSDKLFWATAEKLGMAAEIKRLRLEGKYGEAEPLCHEVSVALILVEADERADADKTGILKRLIRHYRDRKNPLASIRNEYGGKWTYYHKEPNEIFPENSMIFHGDNWWVVWEKK
jgi:hypothetical protein